MAVFYFFFLQELYTTLTLAFCINVIYRLVIVVNFLFIEVIHSHISTCSKLNKHQNKFNNKIFMKKYFIILKKSRHNNINRFIISTMGVIISMNIYISYSV